MNKEIFSKLCERRLDGMRSRYIFPVKTVKPFYCYKIGKHVGGMGGCFCTKETGCRFP